MIIKFKLLGKYLTGNNFSELQVTECSYNDKPINKIIFALSKESEFIIKDGTSKLFNIKNIRDDEIELSANTLKINSTSLIITPIKVNFLFAVDRVNQINNNWEIELSFIHLWNGERIKKIRILNSNNQFGNIIEKNKSRYFFQLVGIKKYDATSKILTIFATDFQELNVAVPLQINLKEVPVKNLEVLNNDTYRFDAQEILANKGLKDYKKIELITNKKINKNEIISFTIPDLRIILQQDREDEVLKVGEAYDFLTKNEITSEVTTDDLAEEEIEKFFTEYQNDNYQKRIGNCQKKLQKCSVLLNWINFQSKTQANHNEELVKKQDDLSRGLEIFTDRTKLQKRASNLKGRFFSFAQDYQDTGQVDRFQKELRKIDQEFSSIEKEIEKHDSLVGEHLKKNWALTLQNDPQFKELLIKHNLSQPKVLDSLNWWDIHSCLQEDGSLDYSILETHIQGIKVNLSFLNDLGYGLTEISSGEKYEKWSQAQIKKSEAIKAIGLNYSPEQWKNPRYQEYKSISRVLADIIIETLSRRWVPPLTDAQKKKIKSSSSAWLLTINIINVQEERFKTQAKIYFEEVIDQELKKIPEVEPSELVDLMNYRKEINNSSTKEELRSYFKRAMTEIQKIRSSKLVSIEELKEQAKKNISEVLANSKLKASDLHSRYQNWSADIEKMKDNSQIFQFEQDLILLLEEINCFLQVKWFPNLDPKEKVQIKQAKDVNDLEEKIKVLLEGKRSWLTIWQINFFLQNYRELQDKKEQEYFLQVIQLSEIEFLLKGVNSSKEKTELLQILSKVIARLHYLHHVKFWQQKFNEIILQKNVSFKEKEAILKDLQKAFQEWSNSNKLNENEAAAQAEIETNLDLAKQAKTPKKWSLFNERQADLSLLNLPKEASEESEVQAGNDFALLSRQVLTLLAFGGFLLILFWRWYRKKREEDPFW